MCDLDSKRLQEAKQLVNEYYGKKSGKPYDGVTVYADYRQLLQNKDIDAVIISTPDHWHAAIGFTRMMRAKMFICKSRRR